MIRRLIDRLALWLTRELDALQLGELNVDEEGDR